MSVDPAFWDGIAASYAAKPVEDPAAFERKIAITRGLMGPGCVVADVGCGTGSLALRLADAAAAVHGVDCSGEMVRIARGKAEGVEHVRFHQGTIDDVPLEDGSLDGLCAYSLLHLVADRPAFLRRAFTLLRPGGFLVTSTVCLGDTWVPYRPLLAAMRWAGKAPAVWILRTGDLLGELAAAGFVDIETPDVGAKPTIAFTTARKPR